MDELKKIKILLDFNRKLQALLDAKIKSEIDIKDNKDYFLIFVLTKAYKTHQSILLLCEAGYGEDAFMLSRTLFELTITSLYILQDENDDRLFRYIDYDWVTRKKMYDYVKTKDTILQELNKQIDQDKDSIDNIEIEYKRVMEKYSYGYTWSDKDIKGMAEAIGRLDAYNTVYKLQCTVGHTNARSMNEYITEDKEGQLIADIGSSPNLVDTALVVAYDFFGHLIEAADKKYKWELEKPLDELTEEYVQEIKKAE